MIGYVVSTSFSQADAALAGEVHPPNEHGLACAYDEKDELNSECQGDPFHVFIAREGLSPMHVIRCCDVLIPGEGLHGEAME